MTSPLEKNKTDYQTIINKISAASAVGIDAQFTHAIIIDFLQQIEGRLIKLEKIVSELKDK